MASYANVAKRGQPAQPGVLESQQDVKARQKASSFLAGSLPKDTQDPNAIERAKQQPTEFTKSLGMAGEAAEKVNWRADEQTAATLSEKQKQTQPAAAPQAEKKAKRGKGFGKPNPLKYRNQYLESADVRQVSKSGSKLSSMVESLPSLGQLEGLTSTKRIGVLVPGILKETWEKTESQLEEVPATLPWGELAPLLSAYAAVASSGATNLYSALFTRWLPALERTYLSTSVFAHKAAPLVVETTHSLEHTAAGLLMQGKDALSHTLGGGLRQHNNRKTTTTTTTQGWLESLFSKGSVTQQQQQPKQKQQQQHVRQRSKSLPKGGIVSISEAGQEIADSMREDEATYSPPPAASKKESEGAASWRKGVAITSAVPMAAVQQPQEKGATKANIVPTSEMPVAAPSTAATTTAPTTTERVRALSSATPALAAIASASAVGTSGAAASSPFDKPF
jgi:hypothetical protein